MGVVREGEGGGGGSDQALQTPETQLGVPPEQTTPQAPQWVTLVRVSVSQPLLGSPSQSPKPTAHTGVQLPPVQALEMVFPPVAQTTSQPPQLEVLLLVLMQVPEQLVVPAGQPQVPLVHTWVAGQAVPQAPQWVALMRVSVSQPSVRLLLQSPKPVWHVQRLRAQPPAEFDTPVAGHAAPEHAPQRAAVFVRS